MGISSNVNPRNSLFDFKPSISKTFLLSDYVIESNKFQFYQKLYFDKHIDVIHWLKSNVDHDLNETLFKNAINNHQLNMISYLLKTYENNPNMNSIIISSYLNLLNDSNIDCSKILYNHMINKNIINKPYQINDQIILDLSYDTLMWIIEYMNDRTKIQYLTLLFDHLCDKFHSYVIGDDINGLEMKFDYICDNIDCDHLTKKINEYFTINTNTCVNFMDIVIKIINKYNITIINDNIDLYECNIIDWYVDHQKATVNNVVDTLIKYIDNKKMNYQNIDKMINIINKINDTIYFEEKLENIDDHDILIFFELYCIVSDNPKLLYLILNRTIGFEFKPDFLINICTKLTCNSTNLFELCYELYDMKMFYCYNDNPKNNVFYKIVKRSDINSAKYLSEIEPFFQFRIDDILRTKITNGIIPFKDSSGEIKSFMTVNQKID